MAAVLANKTHTLTIFKLNNKEKGPHNEVPFLYYHIGYISSFLICCVIGAIAGEDDKKVQLKKTSACNCSINLEEDTLGCLFYKKYNR